MDSLSPGNLSNAKAAFLHPLRNRPFLSEMDPNRLAREQPKLCYWNKLCPWQQQQQKFTNTRVHIRAIFRSRRYICTFECVWVQQMLVAAGCSSGWCNIRAIRFLLASGTEESAINSAHNARRKPLRRSRNIPRTTLVHRFILWFTNGATSIDPNVTVRSAKRTFFYNKRKLSHTYYISNNNIFISKKKARNFSSGNFLEFFVSWIVLFFYTNFFRIDKNIGNKNKKILPATFAEKIVFSK